LDSRTLLDLNVFGEKQSLFEKRNRAHTILGKTRLKWLLGHTLLDKNRIVERQEAVHELMQNESAREKVERGFLELKNIYDVVRSFPKKSRRDFKLELIVKSIIGIFSIAVMAVGIYFPATLNFTWFGALPAMASWSSFQGQVRIRKEWKMIRRFIKDILPSLGKSHSGAGFISHPEAFRPKDLRTEILRGVYPETEILRYAQDDGRRAQDDKPYETTSSYEGFLSTLLSGGKVADQIRSRADYYYRRSGQEGDIRKNQSLFLKHLTLVAGKGIFDGLQTPFSRKFYSRDFNADPEMLELAEMFYGLLGSGEASRLQKQVGDYLKIHWASGRNRVESLELNPAALSHYIAILNALRVSGEVLAKAA
jgi:hypothetical protein